MAFTIGATISATGWGDRRQSLFMDTMVKNSAFLNKLTIVDGVKSKALIPIYGASLTWGNDICDLTNGTGGEVNLQEKEVSVETYTWYFNNCKKTLEATYRSMMLRKGQLNEQTLDDELKDWLLNYFAKLNAEKCIKLAADELRTLIDADNKVVKPTITKTAILDILDEIYAAIPESLLDILYGEADRELKPVIMMNSQTIRDYSMEVAKKDTISYNGISKGEIPPYMGLEIVCFNTLKDGEILIAQPSNLLLVTDDFGDAAAIESNYEKKKNLDEFFGQFKLGFNYRYSEYMIYKAPKA